jgi:hypothetical protein
LSYIGKIPATAPLTSSDVTDGIITNAKLAQDIISADTALGAAPADTDEFLVSDAGVLKRMDYSYIKGGGKIGQVVVTTKTDTASVASASYADMSGMTVAITPAATSSKILLMGTAIMQNHSQYSYFQFVRDIGGAGYAVPTGFVGDAAGSRIRTTGAQLYSYFANDNISFPHSWHLVDSPSTTSACTYKMQCRNSAATTTIYLNRSPYDGDAVTGHRSTSTLIAMEILA